MPLWKSTQHSFAAGQLDALVMGRQDMDKYSRGATRLENFLVRRQGCISKRRGTDLVADLDGLLGCRESDDTVIAPRRMRLVPVTNGDDGRYLILSGGRAFVADRRGLVATDRSRMRRASHYYGEDVYGRPIISGGVDRMESETNPVELVRETAAGVYENSLHPTLSSAFEASRDGDVVRLHHDYQAMRAISKIVSDEWTFSDGGTGTVRYDPSGFGRYVLTRDGVDYPATRTGNASQEYEFNTRTVVATRADTSSPWTFSDGGDWTCTFKGVTVGGSSYNAYVLEGSGGTFVFQSSYSTLRRVEFPVETVTATKAWKRVTLDLYGYEFAVCESAAFVHAEGRVRLTVTSRRRGGRFTMSSSGTPTGFQVDGGAEIVFDGGVSYTAVDGHHGALVRIGASCTCRIASGTFRRTLGGDGSTPVISVAAGASLTVEGGTFSTVAAVGRTDYTTSRLFGGTGTLTVMGGVFSTTESSSDASLLACTRTFVDGGRFSTGGCPVFASGSVDASYQSAGFRIRRGLFASRTGLCRDRDWTLEDVAFKGYGDETGSEPNDAFPDSDGFYGLRVRGEWDYELGNVGDGQEPYRIAVPYRDEDLADLCVRQSGDTLFVAHRDYPPARIRFDQGGFAYFEEIEFDNTSVRPPEIVSCEMTGQEPKEADWPNEFPDYDATTGHVFDKVPQWIREISAVKLNGVEKPAVEHLDDFVKMCMSLGTVTNAGFSGNTSDGSDGSCTYAASYSCTSVEKDYERGRSTTTVSVLSFTRSVSFEVTTSYVNGVPAAEARNEVATAGAAMNSSSAASVLNVRTVKYVATYVKDGAESRPSVPASVQYDMPWANNAVVRINLGRGPNDDDPDYYNVYKDNGNGYGLISTTADEAPLTTIDGYMDTWPLYMPALNRSELVSVADWEASNGWASGSAVKRLLSSRRDDYPVSTKSDFAVLVTSSNAARGIVFGFDERRPTRFRYAKAVLDARMYDEESNATYLVPSYYRIKATLTYVALDGSTKTFEHEFVEPVGDIEHPPVNQNWYRSWASKQRVWFTAPNGDRVLALLIGVGDQTKALNAAQRSVRFDFSEVYADVDHVKSLAVRFIHDPSVPDSDYWNSASTTQGVVHAFHFYRGGTGYAADVEDDYVNPDMTVTPPRDDEDPHFSVPDEYPGCVGLYEQRLVFASSRAYPSTIWLSRTADLYNFTAHDSIREDDALELTLAATEFPNINHVVMGRDLVLFADGGEWVVSPYQGNALTYRTASCRLQSYIGSSRTLQPIQVGDETVFAERGAATLRTINYSYSSDSYKSADLSVISASIFRANPVVSMAYKQHPDSVIECVLADGTVATLVYMPEQEVAAWSVQVLGGGWKAREIATPKCIVNGTTEMMLLVERDGAWALWKVRDDVDSARAEDRVVLDGLHFEASPAAAAPDESAVFVGRGRYAVGHAVRSEFVCVRPEPEKGATAQFEVKNATETEIRVVDGSTFSVKPYRAASGWTLFSLPPEVGSDGSVRLHDMDAKRVLSGLNGRDGRIQLVHEDAWPMTVLSVSNTFQVEYENQEGGGNE